MVYLQIIDKFNFRNFTFTYKFNAMDFMTTYPNIPTK